MFRTIDEMLVKPVRFRKAMDLIFSANPQSTRSKSKVWRTGSLPEELLGEVVPIQRDGKLVYQINDADGNPMAETYKLGDAFPIVRGLTDPLG